MSWSKITVPVVGSIAQAVAYGPVRGFAWWALPVGAGALLRDPWWRPVAAATSSGGDKTAPAANMIPVRNTARRLTIRTGSITPYLHTSFQPTIHYLRDAKRGPEGRARFVI